LLFRWLAFWRSGADFELFLGPLGFFAFAEGVPGTFHERDAAAALGFALVGTFLATAAAEAFAFVLAAASVLFGGGTSALTAAGVLAVFALTFALVEAAAEVDFGFRDGGFGGVAGFATAQKRTGGESAEGGGSELVEIAAIETSGHRELHRSLVRRIISGGPIVKSSVNSRLVLSGNVCVPHVNLKPENFGRRDARPTMNRLDQIREKVHAGRRLNLEDGLFLYEPTTPLQEVGELANFVREQKNGNRAYFNINTHLNATNICVYRCTFCAFRSVLREPKGYAMSDEQILARGQEAVDAGCTEMHIVGGLHHQKKYEWYVNLVRILHEAYPELHLKAWTGVEINWFEFLAK
jgi:hypothetical protein